MYISEEAVQTMRAKQLELLTFFHTICQKQNWRYFLDGGTLLGAVRHQGFIPWDDDIDVQMPYEDYKQFLAWVKQEKLPSYYTVIAPEFDATEYQTKILDRRYMIVEEKESGYSESYLFLDIFPLMSIAGTRSLTEQYYRFRSMLYAAHLPQYPKYVQLIGYSIRAFFRIFETREQFCQKLDVFFARPQNRNGKFYTIHWRAPFGCLLYEKTLFEPKTSLFVDQEVYIPKGYDTILRQLYGDYMTYPPEKNRQFLHVRAFRASDQREERHGA